MKQRAKVGILGGSGYSGLELTRLLLAHPLVDLDFVTSDRWVGELVSERTFLHGTSLRYLSNDSGLSQSTACDLVLLATPFETSLELVPRIELSRTKVIDLSGAFRLQNLERFERFYGRPHSSPHVLPQAAYGLAEYYAPTIASARLVANPGCYATAISLSLLPLLKESLVDPDSLVVTAASGVSGAGRKLAEPSLFMEVDQDLRAYKALGHQHSPEIEQTLSGAAGTEVHLAFTPHLLPMKRGILSTATCRLRPGVDHQRLNEAFVRHCQGRPFLRFLLNAEAVRISDVVHSPRCHLGFSCDERHVVVTSAIDNLLKGAASQAVQNLNLMQGFEETLGLLP